MEAPRLTGYIRRFGTVSAKGDRLLDDDASDAENIRRRRKERDERLAG